MAFDPYTQWLKLAVATGRVPDYYELLGVELFELDEQRIRAAYQTRYASVRRYQVGKHAAEAIDLLAELSAACDCLTHTTRRAAYDSKLKRERATSELPPPPPASFKLPPVPTTPYASALELLVAEGALSADDARLVRNQTANGCTVSESLVERSGIDAGRVAAAIAKCSGYPYLELDQATIPSELQDLIPRPVARRYCATVVGRDANGLTIAVADIDPVRLEDFRFMFDDELQVVVASRRQIHECIGVTIAPAAVPPTALGASPSPEVEVSGSRTVVYVGIALAVLVVIGGCLGIGWWSMSGAAKGTPRVTVAGGQPSGVDPNDTPSSDTGLGGRPSDGAAADPATNVLPGHLTPGSDGSDRGGQEGTNPPADSTTAESTNQAPAENPAVTPTDNSSGDLTNDSASPTDGTVPDPADRPVDEPGGSDEPSPVAAAPSWSLPSGLPGTLAMFERAPLPPTDQRVGVDLGKVQVATPSDCRIQVSSPSFAIERGDEEGLWMVQSGATDIASVVLADGRLVFRWLASAVDEPAAAELRDHEFEITVPGSKPAVISLRPGSLSTFLVHADQQSQVQTYDVQFAAVAEPQRIKMRVRHINGIALPAPETFTWNETHYVPFGTGGALELGVTPVPLGPTSAKLQAVVRVRNPLNGKLMTLEDAWELLDDLTARTRRNAKIRQAFEPARAYMIERTDEVRFGLEIIYSTGEGDLVLAMSPEYKVLQLTDRNPEAHSLGQVLGLPNAQRAFYRPNGIPTTTWKPPRNRVVIQVSFAESVPVTQVDIFVTCRVTPGLQLRVFRSDGERITDNLMKRNGWHHAISHGEVAAIKPRTVRSCQHLVIEIVSNETQFPNEPHFFVDAVGVVTETGHEWAVQAKALAELPMR